MMPLWLGFLLGEGYLLYLGQRLIFAEAYSALGRVPAYLLAMPGTVLHELSHFAACKLLGVPTGAVSLFRPRQSEDGSITLGYVMHAEADPLRSALVAIAPLLLVPPLLLGVSVLLLGGSAVKDLPQAIAGAEPWVVVLWAYIVFSAGQGAFPSSGDRVGVLGLVALTGLALLLVAAAGAETTIKMIEAMVLILALPACAALASLTALGLIRRRRR